MIFQNPSSEVAVPVFLKFPELQAVYLLGSHADKKTHNHLTDIEELQKMFAKNFL